jgi:hypothetical protein
MITLPCRTVCAVTLVGLIAYPVIGAEAVSALPAAPVPIQVLSAKKVFLSNLGADAGTAVAFHYRANPDAAYNGFFAAMKSWGQYDLTTTPAESDLVFEFRVTAAPFLSGATITYLAFLNLTVVDTKTHFVLWTLRSPLDVTSKIDEDVNISVAALTNLLKSLTAITAAPQSGH